MANGNERATSSPREVLITRLFDAPREIVFNAWADPDQLVQWYAPTHCSLTYCKSEFREGGVFHTCLQTPGGDCWCKGYYLEIIQPEKIVYTMAFCDSEGNFIHESPVGKDPEWPDETTVTVTFTEQNGQTLLTLHQTAPEAVAKRTGAYPSWLNMLDRLSEGLRAKTL